MFDSFFICRRICSGSLDTTFGTGGKVITPVLMGFDFAFAVAIQDDGRIVVGGYAANGGINNFALVRYETDGTPDAAFGVLGRVVSFIRPSATDQISAIAIQPDGKIVAAGLTSDMTGSDFAVARYNTDGSLDTAFDTDGKVWTDIAAGSSDDPSSVVIQPDNKIVVGGTAYTSQADFAMVRYLPDGSLDTTFNLANTAPLGTGKVAIDVSGGGSDVANGMAIDGTGRFVLGGEIGARFGVARVLGDLAPSAANVNVSGRVTTASGNGLRNAVVSLTDSNGVTRTAITSSFGYFTFDEVAAGQTYIVSVTSKRYTFAPRTINVTDAITDLDMVESTSGAAHTK